jgi:hypothetical protein
MQEAMVIAAIGERRHCHLVPEGRITLRLDPRSMIGFGYIDLFKAIVHWLPLRSASIESDGYGPWLHLSIPDPNFTPCVNIGEERLQATKPADGEKVQ